MQEEPHPGLSMDLEDVLRMLLCMTPITPAMAPKRLSVSGWPSRAVGRTESLEDGACEIPRRPRKPPGEGVEDYHVSSRVPLAHCRLFHIVGANCAFARTVWATPCSMVVVECSLRLMRGALSSRTAIDRDFACERAFYAETLD